MKNINFFKYAMLFFTAIAVLGFYACSDDDDDVEPDPPPVFVEDGFYIKGEATALPDLDFAGLMMPAVNEADNNNDREGLMELFIAVKAGSGGFQIVEVAGNEQITYGPGSDFARVAEDDLHGEEPKNGMWRGSFAESDDHFTVPEDGLYQIALDQDLGVVVMAKADWGVIGGATPGGWGEDTPMPATFDLEEMTFTVDEIVMAQGAFKFRYANGWKMFFDDTEEVSVNTNFGTSVDNIEPGGPDIPVTGEEAGIWTYSLYWKLGEPITASSERLGDFEFPEYPDAMYLVGAATFYGWDEPGTHEDALMHPIAGGGDNDGIFWKIAHLEGGAGFKMAAAGWGEPNLGFGQITEFDAEGYGVSDDGDGNMAVAESGMYMIVLDLRNDEFKVSISDVHVYGIGDAFGGWDAGVEANLFTVDHAEKLVISPPLPESGNIRMYTAHQWIPDWWNAEFNVFDGVIEYRGSGGDQAPVAGTAGQVITLHFDDNTGSIE